MKWKSSRSTGSLKEPFTSNSAGRVRTSRDAPTQSSNPFSSSLYLRASPKNDGRYSSLTQAIYSPKEDCHYETSVTATDRFTAHVFICLTYSALDGSCAGSQCKRRAGPIED